MKVLEIAIGLILIYFLYSLLSSIIAEMISSWIGMRARMLRQGIENILNDIITGTRRDFVRWLKDIFLVEDNNFKYTSAGKFFEEPTIKYLAKPGEHKWYSLRNRKPAYISAENFVVTILNMFSTKGRGISEWDKIKFAIETNALHLDPETLKMFQDMVKRADNNFKNFVGLLQNHFADTMERVNGWYKRKIGLIIFYIGLVMAIAFNVDTIQIVKTLSNDPAKRLEMVGLAEDVIEKKSGIDSLLSRKDTYDELKYKTEAHGIVKNAVLKSNSIIGLGWDFPFDSINLPTNKYVNLINEIGSLKSNLDTLTLSLDTMNKKDLKNTLQKIADLNADLNFRYDVLSDSIDRKNRVIDVNESKNKPEQVVVKYEKSGFSKTLYVIGQFLPFWKLKFWGILITALALTLGSQFWFDLLKKLVALRGAGIKPEENEEKKKQLEKLKLSGDTITSKDPVEIAISQNRGYWESLPGVVAINKSNKIGYIQIIAENPDILKPIIGEDVITNDGLSKVQVEYMKGEKAKFLTAKRGFIYLDDPEDRGSIAGIFLNNRTGNKCYLTCAHVVQRYEHGHFEYNNSIVKHSDNDKPIGEVRNLIRSSFIDAAIIDFKDNLLKNKYDINEIKMIKELHELTSDQLNNISFKSNAFPGPIIGSLEMSSFSCVFSNNRFMYNLMLIKHENSNYSDGGDSGSLLYVPKNPSNAENGKIAIGILVGSAIFDNVHYSIGISLKEVCNVLSIKTC